MTTSNHSSESLLSSSKRTSAKDKLVNIRESTLFIVSTVGLGLFSDLFLYSLIVPIIPFILRDRLDIPPKNVQNSASTLLAAYAGASVLSSPFAGFIAGKSARRQWPFLFGLTALTAGTLLLCLGHTFQVLVLGRVLQGMSTALVWTVGLALLLDTVGSARLGVTIGSIFGIISAGQLAAPVLGGLVYDKAGYNAVFATAFAVIGIDFVMRIAIIEGPKTSQKRPPVDPDQNEEPSENSATVTAPLLGNGSQSQKWRIDPRQPSWKRQIPIMYPLSDLRLLVAEFVAFMQSTLLSSFDATLPTETQSLFGFSSLQVGLLFLPLVIPYLFLNPVFGKLVDKYGPKPAAMGGFLWEIVALALLRMPALLDGPAQIAVFCIIIALNGIGLAAIGSSSIVAASYVAEGYFEANPEVFGGEGPYAQLYSVNSLVFSGGLTFGPIISGLLRESIGYGNMTAVMAGLSCVTVAICYMYMDGRPQFGMGYI